MNFSDNLEYISLIFYQEDLSPGTQIEEVRGSQRDYVVK